jgi:predicted Zn-dependent peptidase
MSVKEYQLYTLDNGLRVAYQKIPSTLLVHCGFIIHAGSRNDGPIPGLAHALEHMVFKGTQKRKTIHVLNHLEVVGGELNAFTTKELTAIYATTEKRHLSRAVDILCDVTFRSSLPKSELIKEKKVIKDEINMYIDTPEENIYDEFQEMVFGEHPLAHNILGTPDTVDLVTQEALRQFVQTYYQYPNMVFAVVGNVSIEKVISNLNKFLPEIQRNDFIPQHSKISISYCPSHQKKESDFSNAYAIMGAPTFEEDHPNRFGLLLLNNLLGGPGMNSRLNLSIREKHGYTYHVESGYQAFSDGGLFHCYLSAEEKYIDKSIELITKELKKLKENKLGKIQLSQAKNQFIGQIIMSNESRNGLMIHIGKGVLKYNKAMSLQETIQKIKNLTAEQLLDIANEVFDFNNFSHLQYISEK